MNFLFCYFDESSSWVIWITCTRIKSQILNSNYWDDILSVHITSYFESHLSTNCMSSATLVWCLKFANFFGGSSIVYLVMSLQVKMLQCIFWFANPLLFRLMPILTWYIFLLLCLISCYRFFNWWDMVLRSIMGGSTFQLTNGEMVEFGEPAPISVPVMFCSILLLPADYMFLVPCSLSIEVSLLRP